MKGTTMLSATKGAMRVANPQGAKGRYVPGVPDQKWAPYHDLIIALVATSLACAEARDELTEEVVNWVMTQVLGSAFIGMPEQVLDELWALRKNPPQLKEIPSYLAKLDEGYRAYFDLAHAELEEDLRKKLDA